jgi:hypothetical protein
MEHQIVNTIPLEIEMSTKDGLVKDSNITAAKAGESDSSKRIRRQLQPQREVPPALNSIKWLEQKKLKRILEQRAQIKQQRPNSRRHSMPRLDPFQDDRSSGCLHHVRSEGSLSLLDQLLESGVELETASRRHRLYSRLKNIVGYMDDEYY